MIYLNQAATTYPKPEAVIREQIQALQHPPLSQFRSAGVSSADVLETCRSELGRVLGIQQTSSLHFASGATDALNKLLGGLLRPSMPIVFTQTEHNSVLRPLHNHPEWAHSLHRLPCCPSGRVLPESLETLLHQLPAASNVSDDYPGGWVIINHCSNVTGAVQEVETLVAIAHRHGFAVLLDASQSVGCLPVEVDAWGVDALAFTGHKALFGPQGTGGYWVRPGLAFRPVFFGGTGRDSSRLFYDHPDTYEFEVGTQNQAGTAGLLAGVRYVLERGVENIWQSEQAMVRQLYEAMTRMKGVKIYSELSEAYGPLLAFNLNGMKPVDAAYVLAESFGIILRAGLHCAPLIHQAMGCDAYGCLRVSVSDLTTHDELESFLKALSELIHSLS